MRKKHQIRSRKDAVRRRRQQLSVQKREGRLESLLGEMHKYARWGKQYEWEYKNTVRRIWDNFPEQLLRRRGVPEPAQSW